MSADRRKRPALSEGLAEELEKYVVPLPTGRRDKKMPDGGGEVAA